MLKSMAFDVHVTYTNYLIFHFVVMLFETVLYYLF